MALYLREFGQAREPEAPPCTPILGARRPWWQQMHRIADIGNVDLDLGHRSLLVDGQEDVAQPPSRGDPLSPYKKGLPHLQIQVQGAAKPLPNHLSHHGGDSHRGAAGRLGAKGNPPTLRLPSATTTSWWPTGLQHEVTSKLSSNPSQNVFAEDMSSGQDHVLDLAATLSSEDFLLDAHQIQNGEKQMSSPWLENPHKHGVSRRRHKFRKTPPRSANSALRIKTSAGTKRALPHLYRRDSKTTLSGRAINPGTILRSTDSDTSEDPDHLVDSFCSPSSKINGTAAAAAFSLADRYKDPVGALQASHAKWRRKHDALVHRRLQKVTEVNSTNVRAMPCLHAKNCGEDALERENIVGPQLADATVSSQQVSSAQLERSVASKHAAVMVDEIAKQIVGEEHPQKSSQENQGTSSPSGRKNMVDRGKMKRQRSKQSSLGKSMGRVSLMERDTEEAMQAGHATRHGSLLHAAPEDVLTKLDTQSNQDVSPLASLKQGRLLLKRSNTESVAFDRSLAVAKEHNLPVEEVHEKWSEFVSFDKNGNGILSIDEFESAVRQACQLPSHVAVPKHLLARCWDRVDGDGDGLVSFEEYVVWSVKVAYSEEVLVPNIKERELRRLARSHGLLVTEVERIKDVFDTFDTDQSGNIDEAEFYEVLLVFMNVKNRADVSDKKLKRYWREADRDRSGEISFEEFLLWYYRCFCP